MRLTADLIKNSLSFINPIKERELDLRGNKIPAIENIGVASRDQDSIDFTDNDIGLLGNFPLSPRLQTLLLARNRVTTIQPNLHNSIPNLTVLILTQNRVAELADLEPLAKLPKLKQLSLIDNPIAKKENYRFWVIWRCPSLRFLDFQRVSDAERKKGKELFGTIEKPTAVASKIMSIKSRATFDIANDAPVANGTNGTNNAPIKLNMKEREKVEKMIRSATSLQEIARLEKMLHEGRIPGARPDEMET